MEIVKKNLLSIIAGVIALLAIVFYFWPRSDMQQEALTELSKRMGAASQMQAALSKEATLPPLSAEGGEGYKLGVFPNEPIIQWGKDLTKALTDEAKGTAEIALKVNQRKPLVDYVLPQPQGTADYTFRNRYVEAMDRFLAEMKAGSPPTAEDLKKARDELWATKYRVQIDQTEGSLRRAEQAFAEEALNLPQSLKEQRAQELLVYAEPMAFERSPGIMPTGPAPAPQAIWFAQVHYWIQKDIAQAIFETNAPSGNVMAAPVKNVLKLTIDPYRTAAGNVGAFAGGGYSGGQPIPGDDMGMQPIPGTEDMAAPASPADAGFGHSLTGRMSNDQYDVIPLKLILHVDVNRLPLFLQNLSRNRFITPCQVSMVAVDSVVLGATHNVMYGNAPVAQVTISCEVLMLRSWTTPLMPMAVRHQLGIAAVPQPGMQ